jgi:hypothetical protein
MNFGPNDEYKPTEPVGIGWHEKEQLWMPICPICGYIHCHGVEPELNIGDITHRSTHCGQRIENGKVIYNRHYDGYYILIKGILSDEEELAIKKLRSKGKKFSGIVLI